MIQFHSGPQPIISLMPRHAGSASNYTQMMRLLSIEHLIDKVISFKCIFSGSFYPLSIRIVICPVNILLLRNCNIVHPCTPAGDTHDGFCSCWCSLHTCKRHCFTERQKCFQHILIEVNLSIISQWVLGS